VSKAITNYFPLLAGWTNSWTSDSIPWTGHSFRLIEGLPRISHAFFTCPRPCTPRFTCPPCLNARLQFVSVWVDGWLGVCRGVSGWWVDGWGV